MSDYEKKVIFMSALVILTLITLLALQSLSLADEVHKMSYKIEYCDSVIKVYEQYD